MPNARIPLTAGNLRNAHIYLRQARHLLTEDSIGGSNSDAAGTQLTVTFVPGSTIDTDVAGDKMIFRNRAAVRQFFDLSDAAAGDAVEITSLAPRKLQIRLAR